MMRAIRWSASENSLSLVTIPRPSEPKGDEILVKVGFSGVCGSDLHVIKKEMEAAQEVTLGHEFAGTVVAIGTQVTSVQSGDKVAIDPNLSCGSCRFCVRGQVNFCINLTGTGIFQDGGWAEYCKLPVAAVAKIPDQLSVRTAVLIEPYSCVLNGYKKFGQIPVDAQILVTGAGIIGLLWCSLFHYHGYRDVTVSELSEGRRKIAANSGLGFKICGPADLEARFKQQSAEVDGFDIIVECTGSPRAVQQGFTFLRRGGKLNVFGCCPKVSEMNINPAEIMLKELTIFGTLVDHFTFPAAATLVSDMADKYLSYETLGIKEFQLEDYKEAIELLRAGKIAKAVFAVDSSQ